MKLIFITILLPLSLFARPEILTDQGLSNGVVSVLKDIEVEGALGRSTEFNDCIGKDQFDPKDSADNRKKKAEKAEECFKNKLAKNKDPEALKKLSSSLGLVKHGLIPSQNRKEITEYLSNKLYKSMTGIDRKAQQTAEMLKFSNRKMIDQKVFVDLYSMHLSKSVIFEISRFCFENFRLAGGLGTTFADHWSDYFKKGIVPIDFTDEGDGGFGSQDMGETSDTQKAYEAMFNGITAGKDLDTDKLGSFFEMCANQIAPLCQVFKDVKDKDTNPNKKGANACLTEDRLQKIRKAISDTKAIQAQFDNDLTGGAQLSLDNNAQVNHFIPEGENSLDQLSSVTSHDFLEGGKTDDDYDKLDCISTPDHADCEKFIQIGDSRQKAEQVVDLNLRLQKEVEMARIRAIDASSIEQYLEENGYLSLLEKYKAGSLTTDKIEEEIGKAFDAKRVASLDAIKNKLGSRQLSEDELQGKDKGDLIAGNIKRYPTRTSAHGPGRFIQQYHIWIP
jgi:hypothetical protein